MKDIKVGTMIIGVSDLNKSRSFYEKVFGIETIDFRPPFMQGKLGDIEFNIEENASYRGYDWASKNIGTRKSFTFEVVDIYKFVDEAKEAGARIVKEPMKQEWGWYEAIIADADDNEFVIDQEIK